MVFNDLERAVKVAKEEAYKITSSNEEANTGMEKLEEMKKQFEDQNEELRIINKEKCSLHGICEGKDKQISSLRTTCEKLQTESETLEKLNEDNLKILQNEINELNATFSKQKKILEDHLENTTAKYDALV
ncbi:hypothetical protein DPMN_112964 [Dreissena polymorpha]|uniref:Uncharacterized protein n=1 Tax=Dreissena polymorpha TaxID=45954 RepID=A0A9D4KHU9_DREPO|nr:hypothetical protein DPMN_112964 [Dreissena polymorpha]